jgi:hypothetical protein
MIVGMFMGVLMRMRTVIFVLHRAKSSPIDNTAKGPARRQTRRSEAQIAQ